MSSLEEKLEKSSEYGLDVDSFESTRKDVKEIDVDRIGPNPYQPRLAIEEDRLEELIASIRENGLLQPITVTRRGRDYIVVAGHRRLEAYRRLGKKKIQTIVRNGLKDKDLMLMAYVENAVRVDLDVIEQSEALHNLLKVLGSQSEIVKATGLAKNTVSRKLQLRRLAPKIVADIREKSTTADYTALAKIASVKDEGEQWKLYRGFLKDGRKWLQAEMGRRKRKGSEVRTREGVYVPGAKFSLSPALARKLDGARMKKLMEYARKLAEEK